MRILIYFDNMSYKAQFGTKNRRAIHFLNNVQVNSKLVRRSALVLDVLTVFCTLQLANKSDFVTFR